jgi:co-chaperonin GroES (HSP10)
MIKPLHDMVLVQHIDNRSAGGIALPQHNEIIQKGVVLAVGPGAWYNGVLYPMDVKPGDKILYKPNMALKADYIKDYVLVPESQIVGIE